MFPAVCNQHIARKRQPGLGLADLDLHKGLPSSQAKFPPQDKMGSRTVATSPHACAGHATYQVMCDRYCLRFRKQRVRRYEIPLDRLAPMAHRKKKRRPCCCLTTPKSNATVKARLPTMAFARRVLTKGEKLLYVLEGQTRSLQLGQQPQLRSLREQARRGTRSVTRNALQGSGVDPSTTVIVLVSYLSWCVRQN